MLIKDWHNETAIREFGVLTKETRLKAKWLNYFMMYGGQLKDWPH